MKIETLERFLNKDQDLWTRQDLDKLTGKYGKNAIFYDTDGLNNKLFLLFKYRHMSENDSTIVDFISGKNKSYLYIIDYIKDYVDTIEFVLWPSEIALQTIYKILCESILSDDSLDSKSEEYKKLKELAYKISILRYNWIIKMEKNKEASHESK